MLLQNYKAKLAKINYFLVMDLHKVLVKEQQTIDVSIQNLSKTIPVYNLFRVCCVFFKH
jgi:hypothetical protein